MKKVACPSDKVYNPKTKRCVKKDGKVGKALLEKQSKTTKACPKGKIRNPATGRCVNKDGKIGQSLAESTQKENRTKVQTAKTQAKSVSKPKVEKAKSKCPKGKILNPATGKCVNKNGKIGKQIGLQSEKTQKAKSKTPLINPQLPPDMIKLIIKNASPKETIKLCNRLSKETRGKICNDAFWKDKLEIDYGITEPSSKNYAKEYEKEEKGGINWTVTVPSITDMNSFFLSRYETYLINDPNFISVRLISEITNALEPAMMYAHEATKLRKLNAVYHDKYGQFMLKGKPKSQRHKTILVKDDIRKVRLNVEEKMYQILEKDIVHYKKLLKKGEI